MPVTSVRWSARRRPHVAKWVKIRIRSPAAKTDSTISSRRASLPDRPASGCPSSRYAAGWLQICLSAVIAARIAPFFGSPTPPNRRRSATSSSSTAWYSPICSGVIVQWSSSSILSGSSAATSGSLLVRRNSNRPFNARSAASPSPDIWEMNDGRDPTRPGLVKSRIAHRSPSPFSIGVPVSARRVCAGMRAAAATFRSSGS